MRWRWMAAASVAALSWACDGGDSTPQGPAAGEHAADVTGGGEAPEAVAPEGGAGEASGEGGADGPAGGSGDPGAGADAGALPPIPDAWMEDGPPGGEDAVLCDLACLGRACGDDGCGGSCGECPRGQVCDEASGQCEAGVAPSACPPEAPYGKAVGQVLEPATLLDCEGQPAPLAAYCERPATYLFTYTGWCTLCQDVASKANAVRAGLRALDPDAEMVFVITQDQVGAPPSAGYCQSVRDAFGLDMPVLVDPAGSFLSAIGAGPANHWHVGLGPGLEIVALMHYQQGPVLTALEALLR